MRFIYYIAQIIENPDAIGVPKVEANENFFADTVIPTAAVITSVISILFIILGGFRYIVGAGAPDQMQQAKNTILYAIIGLAVSIFAVVIVRFVVNSLQ